MHTFFTINQTKFSIPFITNISITPHTRHFLIFSSNGAKLSIPWNRKKSRERERGGRKKSSILIGQISVTELDYFISGRYLTPVFCVQLKTSANVCSFIGLCPGPRVDHAYHYRRLARTTFRIRSFSGLDPLNHRVWPIGGPRGGGNVRNPEGVGGGRVRGTVAIFETAQKHVGVRSYPCNLPGWLKIFEGRSDDYFRSARVIDMITWLRCDRDGDEF